MEEKEQKIALLTEEFIQVANGLENDKAEKILNNLLALSCDGVDYYPKQAFDFAVHCIQYSSADGLDIDAMPRPLTENEAAIIDTVSMDYDLQNYKMPHRQLKAA